MVSGKAGIQTGTKRAWEICEKYKLPRMIFFVTDMDIDNASFRMWVLKLAGALRQENSSIPSANQRMRSLWAMSMSSSRGQRDGMKAEAWDKFDVPEYSKENLGICREALVEAVAETSEEFTDISSERSFLMMKSGAALANVLEGSIVPVLMGSNILARGMYTLMADIVKYLPSPEKRSCTGINTKTNEVYNADYDFAKSKSAYVQVYNS